MVMGGFFFFLVYVGMFILFYFLFICVFFVIVMGCILYSALFSKKGYSG